VSGDGRQMRAPRWSPGGLGPFLAASLLLHAALLRFVPIDALQARPHTPAPFTEVVLLADPAAEAAPEARAGRRAAPRREPEQAPYRPADVEGLRTRAESLSRAAEAAERAPAIRLPQASAADSLPELDRLRQPLYSVPTPPAPASGPEAAASVLGEVASGRIVRPEAWHEPQLGEAEAVLRAARARSREGLEGPAADRAVLERPALPEIDVPEVAAIRLRFWVLPDGTVGEVYPLQKGNAELERVAADYLRRWRFNALHRPDAERVWGEITIQFRPR
jgi:TonB family protein